MAFALVDDMMALAGADAGQQPLQMREFYLNDLLDECCKAASVLALHKGVFLELEAPNDVAYTSDDECSDAFF